MEPTNERTLWNRLADAGLSGLDATVALDALGLDDLDAAADRAEHALAIADDRDVPFLHWGRLALEAALTVTTEAPEPLVHPADCECDGTGWIETADPLDSTAPYDREPCPFQDATSSERGAT